MEATSEQDGGGSGAGDYEALMAALMANRQLLEAKVGINNAMFAASDSATSQLGGSFVVGECQGQKTIDGEQMPLVLGPSWEGAGEEDGAGYEALVAAVKGNREWLEDKVVTNSAVLLRGFDVHDAAEFDAVVEALGWPDIRYVGPAPRTHVHGRVWTANEGPLEQSVYFHHEMVLIKEFPAKVILFCEVPPPEGGETPFVPSFRVTERALDEFPEMVEELDAKGLLYTFTAPSNNNTESMRGRGWEDAFGTSDKSEAETRAKALGMDVEWLQDGGVKTILGPRTLTRVFPGRKGRRMWFNTLVGMHGKELSSATAADGAEIPASFVQRCEEIIEEESVQFRWRKGDILVLDNLATLHGRRPSLPPRRVLVATCK
ncbi:clavaminate synthase-like protein At3g21360 [Hordeum vulgare subsp. vulgare]|uniref:TauD/TfdA-like domain-containing protein n=1 Tax=Hordeum vulgare subsp. vulgare TaxID=112509 RepID=A0A8I6XPL1_HORVV|nr:clavaminate synthase-like protein At3g21360 [Hordeum vulgare subsp. vulgare]